MNTGQTNPVVVPPEPVWDEAIPAVGSMNAAKASAPANVIDLLVFHYSGNFPIVRCFTNSAAKVPAITLENQINIAAHIVNLACMNVRYYSVTSNGFTPILKRTS